MKINNTVVLILKFLILIIIVLPLAYVFENSKNPAGQWQYPSSQSVNTVFFLLAIIIYFIVKKQRKEKRNSIDVDALKSVSDFINIVDADPSKREFVLFLRPFGNDGYSKPYTDSDVYNLRISVDTIEDVICKKIESSFGTKVIALADQNLKKVPRTPLYYKCNHQDWKFNVELLLKRCLFVVIFLPPNTQIRNSLRWEIFTALSVGLRSRMLLLYPGTWDKVKNLTVDDLKKNIGFINQVRDLNERSVGFILKKGYVRKQYILLKEKIVLFKNSKKNTFDPVANITPFLSGMMSIMKENINDVPVGNLYKFRHTNVSDYDLGLTDLQMRVILEEKDGLFDIFGL